MRLLPTFFRSIAVAGFLFAGAGAAVAAGDGLRQADLETVVVHAQPFSSDYKLGPGDKVRVTVYNEEDLSGEFQIDGSGFVRLPLIGQIKAGGNTAFKLEGDVEAALENGYLNNPRVNIEVTAYRPFYIIGEVTRPGSYPYVSNMSALDAVAQAGGYTERAIESTVYIRHEGETEEHDVPADETIKIRPGDVVRVRPTVFWSAASVLSPITSLVSPAATVVYALRP